MAEVHSAGRRARATMAEQDGWPPILGTGAVDRSTVPRIAPTAGIFGSLRTAAPAASDPFALTSASARHDLQSRLAQSRLPPAATDAGSFWRSARAAAHGVLDSVPLNIGHYDAAAAQAIGAALQLRDPRPAFRARLEQDEIRDRLDEYYAPGGRALGKIAGAMPLIAIPSAAIARLAGAARMARATPSIGREYRNILAVGAGTGIAGQGVGDLAAGHLSNPADYLGSAAGGAAGALAAMSGRPGWVGGTSVAVTSGTQDALNGRVRSWQDVLAAAERASDAAVSANLLAVPAGMQVARAAQAVPWSILKGAKLGKPGLFGLRAGYPRSKGELGELMSRVRTILRNDRVDTVTPRTQRLSKGKTILDHRSIKGDLVESKFGRSHKKLRGNQARAQEELPNYRLDHFMPNDLGAAMELPAAVIGQHTLDEEPR